MAMCCNKCGHLSSGATTYDHTGVLQGFTCDHCGVDGKDIPFTPNERQDAFNDLVAA